MSCCRSLMAFILISYRHLLFALLLLSLVSPLVTASELLGKTAPVASVLLDEQQHAAGSLVPNLEKHLSALTDWKISSSFRIRGHHKVLKRAKPAFIFMIRHSIEVADSWHHFFQNVSFRDYKLLVHDSALQNSGKGLSQFFRRHLVARRDTSWCHLTKAQFSLAEEALQDPEVSHVIWLSGDSIPLKSLEFIRLQLQIRLEVSRLCVDASHDRAQMWTAISRRHFESLLAVEGQLFTAFAEWRTTCEDEDMFWVPLKLMGFQNDIKKQCVMWTDWEKRGASGFHNEKSDFLGAPASLRREQGNIAGSEAHPWSFSTIPAAGLLKLIGDADTWFARKFVKLSMDAGGGVYGNDHVLLGSLSDYLIHHVNYEGQADKTYEDHSGKDASTESIVFKQPLKDSSSLSTKHNSSVATPSKSEHIVGHKEVSRVSDTSWESNTTGPQLISHPSKNMTVVGEASSSLKSSRISSLNGQKSALPSSLANHKHGPGKRDHTFRRFDGPEAVPKTQLPSSERQFEPHMAMASPVSSHSNSSGPDDVFSSTMRGLRLSRMRMHRGR